ncbi:MAG: cytochrome P450 [Pseudomonadota bacterium]
MENPAQARGPRGHFLFGVIPAFRKDPIGLLMKVWREFGDVVRLRVGPISLHLLVHPDHVKHVLVDNHRNYQNSAGREVIKELLGEGLLTSDGGFWRKQRRIAQPAFHMAEIAAMASTMAQITQDDLPCWLSGDAESEVVDVAERFRVLTLRIAGITLFNVDLSDESADFGRATTICLGHTVDRTRSLLRLPLYIPTPANRRFVAARATLDRLIYKVIEERRSGKAKAAKKDLLQMFLDARDPETGEGMSDKELRDELLTMLGAGHETTALALTWTCYFLARYPDVRANLVREIESVLGARTPTLEDLRNMPYTRMVLEESLRLRSPFWLTGRKAIADDVIGGYTIRAGTEVLLVPFLTHRHPDFWESPEVFDPNRFSEANGKDRHPYAMFPFGGGQRKCIGINFAMMEMQLVLPMIVRAVDFSPIPSREPALEAGLTLRPADGCWMTVRAR